MHLGEMGTLVGSITCLLYHRAKSDASPNGELEGRGSCMLRSQSSSAVEEVCDLYGRLDIALCVPPGFEMFFIRLDLGASIVAPHTADIVTMSSKSTKATGREWEPTF